MRQLPTVFLLLSLCCPTLAGPPLTLRLPDAGTYSYWVQSRNGAVSVLPANVSRRETVQIAATFAAGDHVSVLDAHTGQIATRPITLGPKGVPATLAFAFSDFRPAASLSAPPLAPKLILASAPDAGAKPGATSVSRLLTGIVGLALAGAVGWLLLHLVRTRGRPLVQAARRAGVDVPDPTPMREGTGEGIQDVSATVIYTPARRAPDPIPDEAGLPAETPILAARRGPEISLSEIPALVGVQGLVAGGTFALSDGDVTIGRDGENEIVLAENTVSRRHARLLRDGAGQFTLTDLGSANGVYINGMRVQRALLSGGDEIKIGDNYFRFHAGKETKENGSTEDV